MKTLTRDQLKNMLDRRDDILVINVLDRDQFAKSHIPGSVNIPLEEGEFLERVEELVPNKDKRIITYCASFKCLASTEAAKKLDTGGYKAVFDYKGGIQDWMEAGYPFEGRIRAAA